MNRLGIFIILSLYIYYIILIVPHTYQKDRYGSSKTLDLVNKSFLNITK